MARTDGQINVRLPADLIAWLKSLAADNRRSMAAELSVRLEECRRREAANRIAPDELREQREKNDAAARAGAIAVMSQGAKQ